jgi:phage virion morphogenesis protein
MNDLAPIEQLCRDLLLRTAAPERARLMRSIAREIRKSQSDRIAAQRDPDGAAFAPRRPKLDRGRKKGRLRQQKMFRKICMAKSLKAGGNADEAWVGFGGRASLIASIHQDGLADAPAAG